jgi:hypothetical protein
MDYLVFLNLLDVKSILMISLRTYPLQAMNTTVLIVLRDISGVNQVLHHVNHVTNHHQSKMQHTVLIAQPHTDAQIVTDHGSQLFLKMVVCFLFQTVLPHLQNMPIMEACFSALNV